MINKSELVARLSEATDLSKKLCKEVVTALGVILEEELLATGSVRVFSFGKIFVRTLGRRKGRNPATGKTLMVGPTRVLRYLPGHALKTTVKQG